MKHQSGFSPIVVVIAVVIVLAVGGGTIFYTQNSQIIRQPKISPLPEPPTQPTPSPSASVTLPKESLLPTPPLLAAVAKMSPEIQWTEDKGTRVTSGGIPYAWRLPDKRIRLYYCGREGIVSAISTNGIDFEKEAGVRVDPGACDPTIVKTSDGKLRMYYKVSSGPGGPGQAIHKVLSAISSDGLNFQKEGVRIDSEKTDDRGWASVPEAIVLPDGRVRIYYVTGDPNVNGIASTVSENGLYFKREAGARAAGLVDPAIVILPDGTYLMVVVSLNPKLSPYLARGIYTFISKDGLNFENRKEVLLAEGVFDPSILLLDKKTIRIYYGYDLSPNPQSIKSITGVLMPTAPEKVTEAYDSKWLGDYIPVMKGAAANYDYADPEALALSLGYRLYVEERGKHQIVSLFSNDGINWSREEGVRVPNAAFPDAVLLPDGRVRIYFQGFKGINSAISNDGGLTFVEEAGIRVPSGWHGELDPDNVAAPSVVRLLDGRYRMYYIGRKLDALYANGMKHVILSAISKDGLNFTKEDGTRIAPEDWYGSNLPKFGRDSQFIWSYIDGPEAIITKDGVTKLYFWGGCEGICLSKSQDGLKFEKVGEVFSNTQLPVKGNAGDPAILQLKDGTWLLFYNSTLNNYASIFIARQKSVSPPLSPLPTPLHAPAPALITEVPLVAKSETWVMQKAIVGIDAGNETSDAGMPEVIRLADGRYRMYYNSALRSGTGLGTITQFIIKSAISNDGINWSIEFGIRLAGATDRNDRDFNMGGPSIIQLPDGRFRMYYRTSPERKQDEIPKYHIRSAISSDGLTFVKEGIRIDIGQETGLRLAGHGRFFIAQDGTYIGVFSGEFSQDPPGPSDLILTTSKDGLTWGGFKTLYRRWHDPVIRKTNKGYVMYAAYLLERYGLSVSKDGLNWSPDMTTITLKDKNGQTLTEGSSKLADLSAVVKPDDTVILYAAKGGPPNVVYFTKQ